MKSKKTAHEPEMNEFAAEAEKTGDLSHEEAKGIFATAKEAVTGMLKHDKTDESDVARPELEGKRKEPLKYPHQDENNQSRVVHNEE